MTRTPSGRSAGAAHVDPAERWQQVFLSCAEASAAREGLREAALAGRLKPWTELLTGVVVDSCSGMGWHAAARGFPSDRLPQAQHEYLGMDVTAFPAATDGASPWDPPAAVFELENSPKDERVAYSMWKVSCVRTPFAVVFAYRRDWNGVNELVKTLGDQLSAAAQDSGQTLVLAMGSRERSDTFPWSFFRFWRFRATLRGFERF